MFIHTDKILDFSSKFFSVLTGIFNDQINKKILIADYEGNITEEPYNSGFSSFLQSEEGIKAYANYQTARDADKDADGNEYVINALQGEIDYSNSNILYLTQVKAKIKLKNSENMVIQTFLGSLLLLMSGNSNAKTLRENVTSKGGTTEAALKVLLNENQLETLVEKAVQKAYQRSKELSS